MTTTASRARNAAAIIGVGETAYYRHGASPVSEFVLACEAIRRAALDAGIDVSEIDGFASYADDRNHPSRLSAALGCREVRFANMVWGGGGGGVCAAISNAAAAVMAGYAEYVVVYRALAQGQFRRYGRAASDVTVSGLRAYNAPYGLLVPAHAVAMRTRRFMHEHHLSQDPLAAIALTAYRHAQRNPRAIMYGRPLDRATYDQSRWIVEPFHLFDCCQENDGAAAVIVTSAERARDGRSGPVRILASAQGTRPGYDLYDHWSPTYAEANHAGLARDLFARAGVSPQDVDVAQVYENFTGAVVMSLVEHRLCAAEEVGEFCTEANLSWDTGRLPLNTSGGNLAECYMHGIELVIEAARQVRGVSTCQVTDVELALVAGGPVTSPSGSLLLSK